MCVDIQRTQHLNSVASMLIRCFVVMCFLGAISAKNAKKFSWGGICNSYTMGWLPVRGDNPRALASGLSYVQVDKHGITILYHLHECRPCTSRDISC